MPRIMELKEIDGAIWAKLDVDLSKDSSPAHLYTDEEYRASQNSLIEECARAVDESRTVEQWNVDAHQTRFQILKTIRALKS